MDNQILPEYTSILDSYNIFELNEIHWDSNTRGTLSFYVNFHRKKSFWTLEAEKLKVMQRKNQQLPLNSW